MRLPKEKRKINLDSVCTDFRNLGGNVPNNKGKQREKISEKK